MILGVCQVMNNPKVIRPAGIIIQDDKILLVKSRYGEREMYLCPGGSIEGTETIAETVRREVHEETGYVVRVGDLLYAREWINPAHKDSNVLDLFFECTLLSKDETHTKDLDSDEVVISCDWISLSELNKITFFPEELIPFLTKENEEKRVYLGSSL